MMFVREVLARTSQLASHSIERISAVEKVDGEDQERSLALLQF